MGFVDSQLVTNVCLFSVTATTATCSITCPTPCSAGESKCPGGTDSNGCPMPDQCIPKTFGNDGTACPMTCPVTCPTDSTMCPAKMDPNGCPMAGTCISKDGTVIPTFGDPKIKKKNSTFL